ncbi:transcriptional regulator, LysR family [Shewanella sediminis HAW-EB3]|uniref:Transcriptional regulator, LysR family n=1 Tax=Shewanella sediminis (strain HAW-EB3) TaxID=425104 RepID=A8G0G2_SHESH|nr:LysR family transcriptional regulator [Shewanella sediminis]ABV38585.1 transcriptional regulator, LysR family [Shewanella sediminis HAW-EB3]
MNIERLDYHSLIVFESVSRHLNAGLVANELGMSISSVSRHLGILRDIFKDVLFIRRAQGFVLTDKAIQVLPCVKQLLHGYQTLKHDHTQFNPLTAKGHFKIYAYNEFTYVINKVLNEFILPLAPNLTFEIRTLSSDCSRAIEHGEIDFAVVYEHFKDHKIISEMLSPTEELFLIAKAGHPVFDGELNIDNLCKYGYFALDNFNDLCSPLLEQIAKKQGKSLNITGATDNIAALSRHIIDTGSISMSCNVFTREYFDLIPDIQTCPLPHELTEQLLDMINVGRRVGNYLIYSEINQSATHHWLKQQLFNTIRDEWYLALKS